MLLSLKRATKAKKPNKHNFWILLYSYYMTTQFSENNISINPPVPMGHEHRKNFYFMHSLPREEWLLSFMNCFFLKALGIVNQHVANSFKTEPTVTSRKTSNIPGIQKAIWTQFNNRFHLERKGVPFNVRKSLFHLPDFKDVKSVLWMLSPDLREKGARL